MKNILLFSILLCAITLPALGELTAADLDKIRLIVKEEIKKEVTSSETRIKEYISQEVKTVNVKISETDKRLSQTFWWVIALMGLIAVAIGLPQMRSRKDREQVEQNFTREQTKELIEELIEELTPVEKKVLEALIHAQEEKIETLTQEIETLKQQVVNP